MFIAGRWPKAPSPHEEVHTGQGAPTSEAPGSNASETRRGAWPGENETSLTGHEDGGSHTACGRRRGLARWGHYTGAREDGRGLAQVMRASYCARGFLITHVAIVSHPGYCQSWPTAPRCGGDSCCRKIRRSAVASTARMQDLREVQTRVCNMRMLSCGPPSGRCN